MLFLLYAEALNAQAGKIDTTVKMGDAGFHVVCNNKNIDENQVSIVPIGIKINSANPSFKVLGKVTKAFADDMNDDGRPDLVICVYNGSNEEIGTVIGISYNADKGLDPIYFPDIYLDAKIRDGYKGHDEFSALTGTLLRKFPIYLTNDAPDKPTGGIRTIQYKVMMENGRLSFKALRWFDVKT